MQKDKDKKKKVVPSPDQKRAIETRDRTLLVSAAAGSGKTLTLTQRIIASLLDTKNPESLENMLIVTFTNSAVADLVSKIERALTGAVRENPDNKALERELYLLPSARIRTIDAFCGDILRQNADKVGVPPNYRIAEKSEISVLTASTLDTLVTLALEGELGEDGINPGDFAALIDTLTSARNERACTDVFESLYEKSKNLVDGVDAFDKLANNYLHNDMPMDSLPFVGDIMEFARDTLKYCTGTLEAFARELEDGCELEARDALTYAEAAALVGRIPTDSYCSLRSSLLSLKLPTSHGCSDEDKTPDMVAYRERYKDVGKLIISLKEKFFTYDEQMWRELLSDMHKAVSTLCRFLHVFDRAYMGEKLRRGMLEYSDIERFCYKCLYNADGSYTDVARAYQSSLSSIYIDEYQDVNELQDAIFAALSNGYNRFMVGDIKQSIYVFRSANPDIFRGMKDSFPTLADGVPPGEGNVIFMSENYRCDKSVVDFVNSVFDTLFEAAKGSIGYVSSDRLAFAKTYDEGKEPERRLPEIYLLDRPTGEDGESSYSPEFVAEKIDRLIHGGTLADGKTPVNAEDIAIILRTRTNLSAYAAALEARGIPVDKGEDKSYFMCAEVQLALCLLYSIDNPERDVYLAGLMCSPLYSFTADDMLAYRLECPDRSLWRTLKRYREKHPDCKKLADFIDALCRYRALSEGVRVDALILRLYRDTGLFALGTARGGRDNLTMLYNLARKYESGSYRGLYSFICYVRSIVNIGESINERGDPAPSGAVRITTSHSSKGLEYPIVFFVDAAREFHNKDLKNTVAYHEGYGIAAYLRDRKSGVMCANPIKHIIIEKKLTAFLEEELRVLYVTLTRACESLYIVADLPKGEEYSEYLDDVRIRCNITGAYSLRRASSFIEWVLAAKPEARLHHVEYKKTLPEGDGEQSPQTDGEMPPEGAGEPEATGGDGEREPTEAREPEMNKSLHDELLERFDFKYPDAHKTRFPEKISVSRLSPSVLDGADGGAKELFEPKRPSFAKPEFVSGEEADKSAKAGIATHLVLQFFDLERLGRIGAAEELKTLREGGFISEEDASRVRLDELELFVRSGLLRRMKEAKELYREFRFSSTLPAKYFTDKEGVRALLTDERVLVQGVMDCVIIDRDGDIHLVDYKTDRLKPEELADREKARALLNEKHAEQLSYYALAIERIFGKLPRTVSVYSLPLGDCVPITPIY